MKPQPFRDQAVLITGASSGIGRALARAFAGQGAHVALVARNAEKLHDIVQELAALPGQRIAVPADVRDPQQVRAAVQTTVEQFGRLDVLVNNAGKGYCGAMADMSLDDLQDLFATNFYGTVHCYQAALPHLRRNRRGLIIQMSSVSGFCSVPLGGAYSATKFALEAFSTAARLELAGDGVRVLVVRPGVTDTNFFDNAKNFRAMNPFPLDRKMSPDVLARQVLRAAAKGKRELVLTFEGRASYWLHRLCPSLLERIVASYVKARPAPACP